MPHYYNFSLISGSIFQVIFSLFMTLRLHHFHRRWLLQKLITSNVNGHHWPLMDGLRLIF